MHFSITFNAQLRIALTAFFNHDYVFHFTFFSGRGNVQRLIFARTQKTVRLPLNHWDASKTKATNELYLITSIMNATTP